MTLVGDEESSSSQDITGMETEKAIEGFLYNCNTRGGSQKPFPTYCRLVGRHLSQFSDKTHNFPVRSGVLGADIRLEDTGRQTINSQTLYTLRLYDSTNASKEVTLGGPNPEEVAAWIEAFHDALQLPLQSTVSATSSPTKLQGFPLTTPAASSSPFGRFDSSPLSRREGSSQLAASGADASGSAVLHDCDYADSSNASVPPSPHFRRPSQIFSITTIGKDTKPLSRPSLDPVQESGSEELQTTKWQLMRCENGLRLFDEVQRAPKHRLPVSKSVGVVKGPTNAIFDLLMSFDESRSQWDSTFESGRIVESKDGHSDIVHVLLRQKWSCLRPRDLCMSRYWRRLDDRAYSIFYLSVEHEKCPKQSGYVRATIHSGGFIITPLKSSQSGKPRSLVEYVLEMDVSGWSSWGLSFSSYPITLRNSLLSSLAGLREFCAAQQVDSTVTVVRQHFVESAGREMSFSRVSPTSLTAPGANSDSFLDKEDIDEFHDATMSEFSDGLSQTDLSAIIVDGPGTTPNTESRARGDSLLVPLLRTESLEMPLSGGGLQGSVSQGPLLKGKDCWSEPEASNFLVRGRTFFDNGARVAASGSLYRLAAVDWFKSPDRIDHVACRPLNLVQKAGVARGLRFFVVNLQVPGPTNFSLVFYFVSDRDPPEGSLLDRFINGDQKFRDSRLQLIPAMPEGSYLLKKAVGTSPVDVGRVLEINYFKGNCYFEVDMNMGTSGVVRGIISLVISYITALIVDMAFLIRGETEEELPEELIGVVRCSHLALSSAVAPMPEN